MANGLDADYLFLYDDGPDSPNADCTEPGTCGCWSHRDGILADFGSGGTLEMGAAFVTDDSRGAGSSLAMSMAVAAN